MKTSGFTRQKVKVEPKSSDYIMIEAGLAEGEEVALRDPTLPLEELGQETPTVQEKKKPKRKRQSEMIIIG